MTINSKVTADRGSESSQDLRREIPPFHGGHSSRQWLIFNHHFGRRFVSSSEIAVCQSRSENWHVILRVNTSNQIPRRLPTGFSNKAGAFRDFRSSFFRPYRA